MSGSIRVLQICLPSITIHWTLNPDFRVNHFLFLIFLVDPRKHKVGFIGLHVTPVPETCNSSCWFYGVLMLLGCMTERKLQLNNSLGVVYHCQCFIIILTILYLWRYWQVINMIIGTHFCFYCEEYARKNRNVLREISLQ